MSQYEVEIKSLLGTEEKKDLLMEKVRAKDPALAFLWEETQLNHYFQGRVSAILEVFRPYLDATEISKLEDILTHYQNHSVRTRWIAPNTTILVIKASIDDTTSANGKIRREYEYSFPDMSLAHIDSILKDAGLDYQAKWSRTRQSYKFLDMTLCIDKNAGYGYLAEFEKVVNDPSETESARESILANMAELDIKELDQALLACMFDFYNQNWREYYGTDKVFEVAEEI